MAKTPTTRKAASTRKRNNLHVVDGTTGRVRKATVEKPRGKKAADTPAFDEDAFKQVLLEVTDKEIIRTVALLRKELKEAKSKHGATGSAVQAVQAKVELALVEIDNRNERASTKQQRLDGV